MELLALGPDNNELEDKDDLKVRFADCYQREEVMFSFRTPFSEELMAPNSHR